MKRFIQFGLLLVGLSAFGEEPDVFIQYVETDGTQYFDTGVLGGAFTKAEIEFLYVQFPSNGKHLLGSREDSSNAKTASPWYYSYGTGFYYASKGNGSGGKVGGTGRTLNVRYKLVSTLEPSAADKQTALWLAGYGVETNEVYVNTQSGTVAKNLNMYLFALNDGGTPVLADGQIRLYGLKIWSKNSKDDEYELKRDYRPARKDGKACLYDAVGKTLTYPKKSDGSEGTIDGSNNWVVRATDQGGMTPVQQLTNAFTQAGADDIITIERGTYKFPDDVFMTDNKVAEGKSCHRKIRLSLTDEQTGVIIRGEDASGRKTWTEGAEPVVLDGNGGRILQVQFAASSTAESSARIENITFINGDGGDNATESRSGNLSMGGAIGLGELKYSSAWNVGEGGKNVVITNCVFRNNKAAYGGAIGGKCNYTVQDCGFTGNEAKYSNRGGGCMRCGSAFGCEFVGNESVGFNVTVLENCRIADNETAYRMLIAEKLTGCCVTGNKSTGNYTMVESCGMIGCHFTNNSTKTTYQMVNLKGGNVSNCTFYANAVGVAVADPTEVIDCDFSCNLGASGNMGAIGFVTNVSGVLVKDCSFVNNTNKLGGVGIRFAPDMALLDMGKITLPMLVVDNCNFATNVATFEGTTEGGRGAVVHNAAANLPAGTPLASLVVCSNNCRFVKNSVVNYAAGVRGVTAIGCKFDANEAGSTLKVIGADASYSRLVECDCTGGNFYHCSLDRCTVHDVTLAGVFNNGCHVTNTLVKACVLDGSNEGIVGRYNQTGFDGTLGEFVNCTFADNQGTFFLYATNANDATFINCAFFGNKDGNGNATALSWNSASKSAAQERTTLVFENCAYGPLAAGAPVPPPADANFQSSNPRFNAGTIADKPWYLPLHGSPLRNKGQTLNYTDKDVDLAGELRVCEGKVDIGCYECWLPAPGLMLIFR